MSLKGLHDFHHISLIADIFGILTRLETSNLEKVRFHQRLLRFSDLPLEVWTRERWKTGETMTAKPW